MHSHVPAFGRNASTRRPTHLHQVYPRQQRCVTLRVAQFEKRTLDSLVPETLKEMEQDMELQEVLKQIQEQGQAALTREEKLRRQRSLEKLNLPSFYKMCKDQGVSPLVRSPAKIFQLNIGLYCNQACTHCHVESSPKRTEMMNRAVVDRCLSLLRESKSITTLDITGGAPELNSEFRYLVTEARKLGVEVIDRCNLTVLLEPGQEDLAQFLADNKVRVVASLPCYSAANVDKQRGAGVFERSIMALQMLNSLGYGQPDTGLVLDLVYNPGGAFLAGSQPKLQAAYKAELQGNFGIVFNNLFCLNNMPIKRFMDFIQRRGQLDEYMKLLVDNFNPGAAEGIMCRDTVSVRWDGTVYDCDFNQQLDMGLLMPGKATTTIFDINSLDDLTGIAIKCDNHCYGCTAGAGSSCQGATA